MTLSEEDKKIEEKIMPLRFWFLISFSAFLVVTFVFYLPIRFQYNALLREDHEEMMPGEMEGMHREMDTMHQDALEGGVVFHEEEEVKEGLAVNAGAIPMPVAVNVPTRLYFFVHERPGNTPVRSSDLEFDHTKLMHVIGVRSDLNEFFHIHPEPSPFIIEGLPQSLPQEGAPGAAFAMEGVFWAEYTFSKPGMYKIWSEVKKDGNTHTFSHPLLDVRGEGEREKKEVSFGRNVIVGNYQVALQMQEPVAKGHEHDLSFDIHTMTGQEAQIGEYLGAPMHLAVVKDDLSQFIHTHPEGSQGEEHHGLLELFPEAKAHGEEQGTDQGQGVSDETVDFHVVFPEAGLYKVFAQFRPKGIDLPEDEALIASFWLEVKEKPAVNARAVWALLLIASLAAIVILSIGVHKFITVRG